MNEKTWGKTVLGWFVVTDDPQPSEGSEVAEPATMDEADRLIARYAAEAPSAAPRDAAPPASPLPNTPLPPIVDGVVDFDQVFDAAGIGAADRGRIQQARDLLSNLPAETPLGVKQQIVTASLKAFGVATDKIIEAGVGSIQALEAFIQTGQRETQSALGEATGRIAELEQQITELRGLMQQAVDHQGLRTRAANQKKLELQQVLEFFGRDAVEQVVSASPKLHEPR